MTNEAVRDGSPFRTARCAPSTTSSRVTTSWVDWMTTGACTPPRRHPARGVRDRVLRARLATPSHPVLAPTWSGKDRGRLGRHSCRSQNRLSS
ncbi:hypothetical protein QJS66_19680 [Kocuria rhizophila]|nr:hypothetical protein QJS66_19680 [Kocuria rhizophila]